VRHTKNVEIRWSDLDGFGHVSHRSFLALLEEGRDEWIDALVGEGYASRFIIRRIEVDYLSQMTQADDIARVAVSLGSAGRTSLVTAEEVHAASDGRLVARAACVVVLLDDDFARPVELPAALRARIEAAT
jgi:acyl-CoA thioester hydrolase